MAFGRYNKKIGNYDAWWNEQDPLLQLGNGVNDTERSDAFIVMKNSKVGIGVSPPVAQLHVRGSKNSKRKSKCNCNNAFRRGRKLRVRG